MGIEESSTIASLGASKEGKEDIIPFSNGIESKGRCQ
jgi:hypothetical protein